MALTRIPVRLNLVLAGLFLLLNLFQYFILPLFLLPQWPYAGLGLVLVVLATTSFWSLAHEAIHGLFHPRRDINERAGRLFGVLFGSPFHILRFGHLFHHRYSRTELERSEVYDAGTTPALLAGLAYYPRLLVGLYAAELAASLLALLPHGVIKWLLGFLPVEMARGAAKQILAPRALGQLRMDGIVIICLLGVSFWAYGAYWWMLMAALAARGMMISMVDNSFHYGTRLDDIKYAFNLSAPPWLSKLILHFNLHHVHHIHPRLPWTQLPEAFDGGGHVYNGGSFAAGVLRQLRGPIALQRLQATGEDQAGAAG